MTEEKTLEEELMDEGSEEISIQKARISYSLPRINATQVKGGVES